MLGLIRCCLWKLISTKYAVLDFSICITSEGRIRRYLSQDCLVTVIHAFVISRLDYCNSLMYDLPQCQISKSQRVQNAAARIAFNLSRFCEITPALRQLHWLPVVKPIQFKILLLTFKAIYGLSPPYISELITVKPKSTHGPLRSSQTTVLCCYFLHRKCCLHLVLAPLLLLLLRFGTNCLQILGMLLPSE